uniref:exodeoxyribonuclease III n=1 Tax=Seriola dumerili TaxID=41447 RepID=A0A3B4V253_SERDU
MCSIHFISWNINGLKGQFKRTPCLDLLHRQRVDVAFIQESHLRSIDINRFTNKHYYVAASTSLDTKTRGSLVVLKRNLPITVLEKYGGDDGRVSYIKTIIAGRNFTFNSVYAPSQYEYEFFPNLTATLLQLQDFSLILGADMNYFQKFLSALGLTDLYRAVNPTSKQYTFYSARHRNYSGIDYILASPASFSEIHDILIKPCSLSDHSIVAARFTLQGTPTRVPRWRFNTSLLKNEDFLYFLRRNLNIFININVGSVDYPRFVWDAIKGSIRDSSITYSSHLNKNRIKKITELETTLTQLEAQQQWANSLLEIVLMEWSVSRMHGASLKTPKMWEEAYNLVKEMMQRDRH